MTMYSCARCGGLFASDRLLIPPCLCSECRRDEWNTGVERGRRLQWFDSPTVQAETPADQHLRAVGAPTLFELD